MTTNKNKYNHLCKEQRNNIEHLISIGKDFTSIGKSINVDRTTISKEIKRNRYIKSYHFEAFDSKGIESAVNNCDRLKKPPYVCNNCPLKQYCNKHKLYYNATIAQKHSDEVLHESRIGFDITPEEIDEIERTIIPLIKDKKQSVNQVYANHSDLLCFSKTTFYNYVDNGVLSLKNYNLPKKSIYKPRKKLKDRNYKRNIMALKNRKYEDYLEFKEKHPNANTNEMDTVEGKKDGKVFLTLIIVETSFMLIRLLDKKTSNNVEIEIDKLKEKLGSKLFSKIFKIILTDNGSEFLNPTYLERDMETGRKLINIFYCHPYSSFEKAHVERNHEYIRRIFPKGYSLNNINEEQTARLQAIINNIPRDKFNGKTPYELTKEKYPELITKLNCKYIEPDEVTITRKAVLGDK